jgi:Tfp pilus assembly protein PilW
MASPTFSTPPTERRRAGGFTLVELLISFGLASVIMAGVMTTFVMMARTGVLAQNYSELEVEARKALELFSREARMANGITAYGANSVTFTIPDTTWNRTSNLYSVTYSFDTATKKFTRTGPPITDPTGAAATTTLVTNVLPIGSTDFIRYFRYVTSGYSTGFTSNYATSALEIKQIELNFIAQRTQTAVATATDKVLSARFILRNK